MLLRHFVKDFFKYKNCSYSELLEVYITCYIICLFRFLWKPSMLTLTCLNESMNVWNIYEISEIWMKTNVLNMLLWVSDVALLIFITLEVYILERYSHTSILEIFCKNTLSICVIYFIHDVFDFIFITSDE